MIWNISKQIPLGKIRQSYPCEFIKLTQGQRFPMQQSTSFLIINGMI